MANNDILEALRRSTPEQLLKRLAELDAEAKAIRILLRAVRAQGRQQHVPINPEKPEQAGGQS